MRTPCKAFFLFLLLTLSIPAIAQTTGDDKGLLGKGKMFIRFTNLRSDHSKILVRVNVTPNSNRWFGWGGKVVYIGTNGVNPSDKVKTDLWLLPGQSSPWLDIGQYMNLRSGSSLDTYLSPILCGIMTAPKADGIHIMAEVATKPGVGVLRRLEINKPDIKADGKRQYPWNLGFGLWNKGSVLPTLGLMIPTRPDITGRIYTFEESLRWQLELMSNSSKLGRKPEKFVFVASGLQKLKDALEYNGYPDGTVVASQGDEISLHLTMPAEGQDKRFRESLKSRNFNPLDFIADDQLEEAKAMPVKERWSLVHVVPAMPTKPKHFYESAIFRYQLWYEELAAKTRKAEKENPGKRVLSGANFTPHMNVWPDVRQWVDPFKQKALTMSWSEDWWWQLPEISPQGYGFLLDAMRLAGTYHGAPMQFYVMPFFGNSPDNFRRMNALAMAHGAKIFNHFVIQDQGLVTCDYVDLMFSANMFPAINDVIRDAGAMEHRLYPAMPAQADVAILLSRAADTWDTEDLGGAGHLYEAHFNVNNDERKSLWLALRHAQYPVDLITDEGVAEGKLKNYKALYIVGSEMLAEAAKPLKQWVRDGGTVYATAGAGLLDEYHRPQTGLYEMYGIKSHKLIRQQRGIRPRRDFKSPKPLDTLHLPKSSLIATDLMLPTLFYRQTFEPTAKATTLGKYSSDGATGAIMNHFGKGRAILIGSLAGLAYLAPATTESSSILPTAFSDAIRNLLASPARLSNATRPVVTSNPLVEAQYMTSPQGPVVALINWTPDPIAELTLSFDSILDVKKARSLRAAGYFKGHLHKQDRGELEIKTVNDKQQVKLRLDVSDYLLVD